MSKTARIVSNKRNGLPSKIPQGREPVASETRSITASYSGPIPPPDMLRAFEDIQPGAADRIIRLAENESSHRHTTEKMVIGGAKTIEIIGMCFAFLVCLSFLAASTYLMINDKSIEGSFLAGGGVLSILASLFITRRRYK